MARKMRDVTEGQEAGARTPSAGLRARISDVESIPSGSGHHGRAAHAAAAAGSDRRAAHAVVRGRPLHAGHHEDRSVIDATTAAAWTTAATGVDLVAVVLVVGHPVDVVQGAVVVLEGVVVVVPELLQALFLTGEALVALGEDVPARLITAVGQRTPASLRLIGAQSQSQHGARQQADPFHRDSFHREDPIPFTGRELSGASDVPCPIPVRG